jgi:hypothetical protein
VTHPHRILGTLSEELEAFRASKAGVVPMMLDEVVDQAVQVAAIQAPAQAARELVLNEKQADLLRRLVLQVAPVPVVEVDGRVLRVLVRHGLAGIAGDNVVPTEAGRAHFREKVRRRKRVGAHRADAADRERPAEVLSRATRELEKALPKDRVLQVGDLEATVQDVLAGLQHLAERLRLGLSHSEA